MVKKMVPSDCHHIRTKPQFRGVGMFPEDEWKIYGEWRSGRVVQPFVVRSAAVAIRVIDGVPGPCQPSEELSADAERRPRISR